jgi:N-acetylmuramoyl-L-alanine amidase
LNWISPFIVRIFNFRTWRSTLAAATAGAVLAVTCVAPATADPSLTATYQRQTFKFTHLSSVQGESTIGIGDPGFDALLPAVGASLTWQPGNRYVLISTPVPNVVSFAIGDRRYDVGQISLQAAIAPYQQGNEVYLPLREVLGALDLVMRRDGDATVLQPQLASLDVRTAGNRTDLVARAGAPLRPRILKQSTDAIVYEFDGVGTSLTGTRDVGAGGIRAIDVAQQGTVRDPKTLVTVALAPGAVHDVPRSDDGRDVVLSFAGSLQAAQPAPAQNAGAESPQQTQAASGSGTSVTGVTVAPSDAGYVVTIAVTGDAAFEWHRLRDPDNRFWVDVKNAQLNGPPISQSEPEPVGAVRVRQIDSSTVRVALSLTGPKTLTVSPAGSGLTVEVGRDDVADTGTMVRSGSGSVGNVVASGEQVAPVTPAPGDASAPQSPSGWKFGGSAPASGHAYVPRNPRLIVIDPGHGGSDRGTSRHGVDEADLTLDMSKRLRDILVARGWQVRMTRSTDVDVYAPNDSAHDELQARDDVANNAGARLFVSIHVNAFINSGPYGTTSYISKQSDVAFGQIVERQLASDGTKDDGVIKSHLYVTTHALMPAVLVETAFISNPDDYALLTSPAWRQRVAQSIADGIAQYDRQYPATNQPAQ